MNSEPENRSTRAPEHPSTGAVVAYIDGGARGNPGPAGFGVRVERPDGTLVEEFSESIGVATNNVAEYRGLLAALEWARARGVPRVHVRSDSKLLVEQMKGNYKVKHPGLQPLSAKARLLAHEIGRVTFEHVERAKNAHADRLANEAMDLAGGRKVAVSEPKVAQSDRKAAQGFSSAAALAKAVSAASAVALSNRKVAQGFSPASAAGTAAAPSDVASGFSRTSAEEHPFTPLERAVRLFIYRHVVETARAPDPAAIAGETGATEKAVAAALGALADGHAIVLAPASLSIWMAHPFSAVPTPYPVDANGRTYWANCAWDAAGILSLVGDGETRARCADCGQPAGFGVQDGALVGDGVVHYAVPPRRFWDNVAYT